MSDGRALPQSVLRELTDQTLFAEVLTRRHVTRAELAAATGISKPTVSESIRRLTEGGLLVASGPKETGRRGRVGTVYELGETAGWVLAIEVDQSGVRAWSADLAGTVHHRHDRLGTAGTTNSLVAALRAVTADAMAAGTRQGPLRAVGVSMANPVHPTSHEVIALPDASFPEGVLNPATVLPVDAPVLVDNDVNLAALAEQRAGSAAGIASFAYVYVGGGLGLGLYVDHRLIRGAHGLAGEVNYLPGADITHTVAAELKTSGFNKPNAPSTDVDNLLRLLDEASMTDTSFTDTPSPRTAGSLPGTTDKNRDTATDQAPKRARDVLSRTVARVVASVAAVVDPEVVLLGGPVGTHPALLEPVRDALRAISPSPARLAYGTLGPLAPLHGATYLALERARADAVKAASQPSG